MLILALSLAAVPAPLQLARALPICREARPSLVQDRATGRPQRLGELPQAHAYLTVMRTENGCIRPVLVREERARRP
ncbi:hypothetical protein [Sphingomonas sp.]|jgi:hypothetical protein|uniref:hypothetical protein n=1 Tax=Sphingomonas sp. TaxID=28214 RepID=UPI002DE4AFB3|nr:hypothetical protein [Sphingomonas sp.]